MTSARWRRRSGMRCGSTWRKASHIGRPIVTPPTPRARRMLADLRQRVPMARSHAKIVCSVWQDPSWCALKPREQWAFTLLLSQPKLSLVGCLDYMPNRWTTFGEGLTVEYIDRCMDGLEAASYVCIDRETDEILVRTFTRHDGIPITNERLRKGLWGAYGQVASAGLRKVAVDNMPGEFFDFDVPPEADCFRRSARMEWAIERPIEDPSERATDSPVPCSLPPATHHQPTTADTQSDTRYDLEPYTPPKIPARNVAEARDALAALRERKALA
jgi:hypothetical protein